MLCEAGHTSSYLLPVKISNPIVNFSKTCAGIQDIAFFKSAINYKMWKGDFQVFAFKGCVR
jgi:hypothetical protein